MRFMLRFAIVPMLALGVGVVWAVSGHTASAQGPMVNFVDNDAPAASQAIDARQSEWGFGPSRLVVKKGEQVIFMNPTEGKRPHSVTSITLGGTNFENALVAGAKFDSSPSRETLVTPGNSWTLDTSTLDPGNYAYYCRIHPWMVAELTVLAE
jgi:plastocyanin